MAQSDRRAAAAGEFIGKDVFLKSFQQQSGNISASDLTQLVSSAQNLNLSVLKVGSVSGDTVNLIVEGADNLANGDIAGYVIGDTSF
jgi:hypothetical protein